MTHLAQILNRMNGRILKAQIKANSTEKVFDGKCYADEESVAIISHYYHFVFGTMAFNLGECSRIAATRFFRNFNQLHAAKYSKLLLFITFAIVFLLMELKVLRILHVTGDTQAK